MCKTVIRNVLVPLVAEYGISAGLWKERYPGHGVDILDEEFTEYLETAFHRDFALVGGLCTHMKQALTTLKRENRVELNVWIDRRLREYAKLKTVVKGHMGDEHNILVLPGPRDRFSIQREIVESVTA